MFGQTGNWSWEDAVRLCVEHPLHASFFVAKLWGYLIPSPPDEATLASLQGLYTSSGYSIRAVRRGDPAAPRLLRRPGARHAARRLQRGPPARDRPPDRHDRLDVAVLRRRPAAVLPAERLRLGLHPLARHLDRQGALGNGQLRDAKTYANPWPQEGEPEYSDTEEPAAALAERDGLLGQPAAVRRIAAVHRRVRAVLPGGMTTAEWEQSPLPGDPPERAAHADRHLPRHAGELTMAKSCSCNDFNRAQLLRHGIAQAGKGLPRIEPGMPLPAGTGMNRRAFLLALGRCDAVGIRSLDALTASLRRGHRPGRRRRAAQAAGARVDLHGRRLGRPVGARARQGSRIPRTAPDAGSRRRRWGAVHRGRQA